MILIKGLDMPQGENGLLCLDIYPDGRVFINLNADKGQVATAEQFEPRHGRWIDMQYPLAGHTYISCSECREGLAIDSSYKSIINYCPNCGARMDGGEDGR